MTTDVSLFGDWHGNIHFATRAITAATHNSPDAHLVHVGDFGLYPSDFGHLFLTEVDQLLHTPIYVIPGNHESWPHLRIGSDLGFTELDDDGFLYTPLYPNIRVSTRAHTWQWHDRLFAALTGANSIDFQHRKEGRSWWPEESPTTAHVDDLAEQVDTRHVDVLITHDGPHEAIQAANLYPPGRDNGWSDMALEYANESAKVVGQARNRLMPTLHVCGHHHIRRSVPIDGTTVEFLADDTGSLLYNRLDVTLTDNDLHWE